MRESKEIFVIILVVISSSLGLVAYSWSLKPIRCSLEDLKNYEGKYVMFDGIVADIFNYTGGTGIEVKSTNKNSSSRVTVFCDFYIAIVPGSLVEVSGIVSDYGETVNAYSVKILKKYYETTLEEVLRSPEYFVGLHIKLSGNVSDIRFMQNKSRLIITDGVREARVFLSAPYYGEYTNLHFYGFYDGEKIMCYPEPYGIYLNSSEIPIKNISFEDLDEHVGKEVHIVGDILSYETYGYSFYLCDGEYRLRCYSQQNPEKLEVFEGKFLYDYNDGYYYLKIGG